MDLKFKVQLKIQKLVVEVFFAIHNPEKLSAYFTLGGIEGLLEKGEEILLKFRDNPEKEVIAVSVKVQKIVINHIIQFSWKASEGIYDAKTGETPNQLDIKT